MRRQLQGNPESSQTHSFLPPLAHFICPDRLASHHRQVRFFGCYHQAIRFIFFVLGIPGWDRLAGACFVDSGGPPYITVDGARKLAGVVSRPPVAQQPVCREFGPVKLEAIKGPSLSLFRCLHTFF
jgi:hypothetical protein